MFYKPLSHWHCHLAFAATIMASPLAYAAAPMNTTTGGETLNALPFTAAPLDSQELEAARGGFDVSPQLTINFAFEQVDYSGTTVIQSIQVPMITLTQNAPSVTPTIITSEGAGTPGITTNVASPSPSSSKITVTSSANNGLTTVLSQIGNGGITNVISNTANNTLISQATTMNIAVGGMASWISGQRSALNTGGGPFGGAGLFR